MAIKIRIVQTNSNQKSVCCNCGSEREDSLDMFDICIGTTVFTLCDVCNSVLLEKVLKAECYKNGRVKDQHDISIIRKRKLNDKL